MRHQNGFTLMEMIIVMIVTAVLAMIIVTFAIVQSREVAESTTYAQMNRGYDLFLEQFGRDVKFSTRILNNDGIEKYDEETETYSDDSINTSSIVLISVEGNEEIYYSITNDTLKRNGKPFQIGGAVLIVDNTDPIFLLPQDRKWAESYLALTGNDGKQQLLLPVRKDKFKCRN